MRLLVKRAAGPLEGQLVIPCSKYHAHRALILASLAPGVSRIEGLSDAGHVRHTISALRRLGIPISVDGETFVVRGGSYRPAHTEISVGSSGTTLYFLTGLVSLATAPVTIVGQKYFQRRPIGPLLEALTGLGVELSSATGCPPIEVAPRRPSGGRVSISGTLSQWISGLLLLAPFATGPTVITVDGEPNERSYIDLTIAMMAQFGLHVEASPDARQFEVEGNQQPRPANVVLPPDIGSAAFGLAAAALHPSDVVFRNLSSMSATDTDHPEAELLDIVGQMGLPMTRDADTGLVRVRHEGVELQPAAVDCRRLPDALPILSVLGTFADGTTVLDNVAHVRLKESDRVAAMLQLNRMGGKLEQKGTTLLCHGVDELRGADVSSFNDHRVLMSLAIAATRAEGESRLTYPNAYRISYPRFLDEMNGIGMSMASAAADRAPARRRAADFSPTRISATPIGELVRRSARERPDDLALADTGATDGLASLTWRQLSDQADAVAMLLLERGVQRGDRVALQLPNRAEFVLVTLAAARIGAICCPLMPIFRQREVGFMLRKSGARVLFVPGTFRGRDYPVEIAELVEAASTEEPLAVKDVFVVGLGDAGLPAHASPELGFERFEEAVARQAVDRSALAARAPAPDALVQLLFTSGTSGEPKGVLHRMDTLTRAAAMEIRHLGLTADDRVYIPSPLAHQTGFLYGMWVALVLGVPQILQPVWDGREALSVLRRWRGTFVQAATPFLADLMSAVEESGQQPEALRIFVATGTAVPRALAERATRTLGAAVCGAWGTTETCLGSLSAPEDEPAACWGTDGRALAGVRLRITDDDGNVLAPGQEGNFEVSSKCLFTGYLDHPEWTAQAMTADGWYRSGDLAVIDEAGYVRISGRVKDIINRGGEKVPVAEIEQLLHTHPAVRDVAVVAMPDERLGERACAFVVAEPGFDLSAMREFLNARKMARQYWPERLERAAVLPRNPAGKVQKFRLREQIRQLIESKKPGRSASVQLRRCWAASDRRASA